MFGLTPFERKGFDLFNAFDNFDKDFFGSRMFPPMNTASFSTDIKETENGYELTAELPGFKKEDISIDISDEYITVSASHEENKEEKNEDGRFIRKERYSGSYSRSFSIAGIDTDNISAGYSDGVLKIELPKKAEEKNTRRLEVK